MQTAIDQDVGSVRSSCKRFHVKELFLFGSAADGRFKKGQSDYDFLVRFLPCGATEHADRYFGLLETLQDLLDAPVDLVEVDALKNASIIEDAKRSQVRIYAAK